MSTDDLSKPLEIDLPVERARARFSLSPALLGLALAGMGVIAAGAYAAIRGDHLGGEPFAVSKIERIVQTASAPVASKAPAEDKVRESASDVEESSGVRVIRGKGGAAPGSVVIRVPDDEPAPGRIAAPDRRLSEKGKHGPLPKAGPDGMPRTAYARPFDADKARGRPLIAVVVTGLGIGAAATAEATAKLPPEVSFAFAPYGAELERQTARAREAGHELLLQAPMEPFGYPDNDPGPHTLLTDAAEAQNLDRLHWLMSRFQGYVGLTNFMGGKFSGARGPLKTVLDETARRGLLFVEDGTAGRSLVIDLAREAGLPAARGDATLDGLDKAADIDAALARAEAQARASGRAIVFGAALPGTVDRLGRWVRTLEGKGLTLAPVSAVIAAKKD